MPPQCYIDDGNNVHICGGFGTCIYQYKKASYCVCDDGAAVQANGQCASWACVQPGLVTNMACSGFGICANERCICNSIFYGTYCEKVQPNCGPAQIFIKSKEECIPLVCVSNETICNDHGECIRGETTNGVVRAFVSVHLDMLFTITRYACHLDASYMENYVLMVTAPMT